jgi:hypothetical protein
MQAIDKYASDDVKTAVSEGTMSVSTADKKIADKKPPKTEPKDTAKKSTPPKPEKVITNDEFSDLGSDELDEFDESANLDLDENNEPDNLEDYVAEHRSALFAIFDAYLEITDDANEKAVISGIKRFM